MQLVIEISYGLYNNLDTIKNGSIASKIILDCVRKGQVLPKGHGRLIDAEGLDITTITTDDFSDNKVLDVVLKEDVDSAPTIIEEDKN